MDSRWSDIKSDALRMRKRGTPIRDVEKRLGIPRSTLSGWFKNVELSEYHQNILRRKARESIVNARIEAVKWHNGQKAARLALAEGAAKETLSHIDKDKKEILELALAMLYLGEGSKTNSQTVMGNSNPQILGFFVHAIQRLYGLSSADFSCHLHLRADQDPKKLTRYWSRTLGIPPRNFGKPIADKRTAGSATYAHYKGVCVVSCGRVAIQRKLMYIATAFCEQTAEMRA